MTDHQLFIGLMSGTSLDGIDAALVAVSDNHQCQLLDALELPFPDDLRQQLISLCHSGDDEIERLGKADRQLAKCYAQACQKLLEKNQLSSQEITAIGCHGQTIRHRPNQSENFSLQIGDPNTLAQLTGINTVADFRRRDIAAGGQGAPLAPAFHQALLTSQHHCAVINIGGMANISVLGDNNAIGYDTGPGNVLLNGWVEKHLNKPYDDQGRWAASGQLNKALLEQLLSFEYFSKPAPKSTGRESFNLDWLNSFLSGSEKPEDVQATLLELTAQTIANEANHAKVNSVYLCGGGAYNTQLVLRLEALLHPTVVASTTALGIAPEWVEAVCFAWLAKQTLDGVAIKTASVTGATSNQILGGIYQA
jgi:anhydro-N-acetylmuramic acid kinase